MVMVMVGLNYRLKERKEPDRERKKPEDNKVVKTSSVRFMEGGGGFSRSKEERVFV